MDRRSILKAAAGALGAWSMRDALAVGSMAELGFAEIPDGALAEQLLHALPGKVPLIKKTYRPPNYETPVSFLNEPFTPNNAFFVRYHLADIPEVDSATWKVRIGGLGAERQVELTLADLKNNYPKVELAAVCQCS